MRVRVTITFTNGATQNFTMDWNGSIRQLEIWKQREEFTQDAEIILEIV